MAVPPIAPDGLTYVISGTGNNTRLTLTWNDNSINETSFLVQKSTDGINWTDLNPEVASPLDQVNIHGTRSFIDTSFRRTNPAASYRVVAKNKVGFVDFLTDPLGAALTGFPTKTAQSVSASILAVPNPSNLTATLQAGPQIRLAWVDNTTNETGFNLERSVNGGAFTLLTTTGANGVTYTDATVSLGNMYSYRVAAVTAAGTSTFSNTVTVSVTVPADPSNLTATPILFVSNERVMLSWTDNANNETGFTVQRSATSDFTTIAGTANVGANATTYMTGNIARTAWYFRVRAINVVGQSNWVTSGPIAPASASSPLVFLSTFTFGPLGWSGQSGNVLASPAARIGDDGDQGLVADMGVDDDDLQSVTSQPAYVYHSLPAPLGSYMANFYFSPHGATPGDTPVDIFAGHDASGTAIFGVQLQLVSTVYQVRAWALGDDSVIYTDWKDIANAANNIQLDWQSGQTASLNLYVDGAVVASVSGDTSLYKLSEERLGPGSEISVDASSTSATVPSGTVYYDTFYSLSKEASPYTPMAITRCSYRLVGR